MNDLHDVIEIPTQSLYADDPKFFRTIDVLENSTKMLEDMVRLENRIAT